MELTIETVVPTKQPVRIFLEKDSDGDVTIKATDGTTTADIAYILANGRLCISELNGSELMELGFKIDGSGGIDHY